MSYVPRYLSESSSRKHVTVDLNLREWQLKKIYEVLHMLTLVVLL